MAKRSQVFDTRLRNIFGNIWNIEQMEKGNNNIKTAEKHDLWKKTVHLGDVDKDYWVVKTINIGGTGWIINIGGT